MKKINKIFSIRHLLIAASVLAIAFTACKKENDSYEKTRLFRPVLNGTGITVENNVITLNLGKLRDAASYTIAISRDSFKVTDYTVTVDTNYIILNETLLGEGLLYNTLYQIRVTANAGDTVFNSRPAEIGSARTQRFPSILNTPRSFDVTDTKAKVTWVVSGAAVTAIRIFSSDDLRLKTPLSEFNVPAPDQATGETVISGLTPNTPYQVAIYSGTILRGWVNYKTLVAGVDVNDPKVINLSESEDPAAVTTALASVPDGGIILLKKGFRYDMPTAAFNKSVTFKGAYGFNTEKAALVNTSGNMNITSGANISKVVFDDLEIDGGNISGAYVFNPSVSGNATQIQELRFENCDIHDMRGIIRIRSDVFIRNYIISNSIVHHIGGYSILTADTDGANKAAFDNVKFLNSTFYKINSLVQTRQNLQSFEIDGCTFNEFTSGGAQVFRFRGAAGRNDVVNGFTIKNSIFGHGWDESNSQNTTVTMKSGLPATAFTISNTWGTSDLKITAGSEIPGLPGMTYNNTADKLWADPDNGIFSILDPSFAGKYDAGAPVWRTKL